LVSDDDGTPAGILTESDLVRRVIAADRNPGAMPIHEVMTPAVVTIDEGASTNEAGELMAERAIRHLAVTRDGRVCGLLSIRDLLPVVDFLPVAVERMMTRLPVIAAIDETVRNAAALMTHSSVSGLLVAGRRTMARALKFHGFARRDIAGIVTGTDLVRKVVAADRYPYVTTVGEVMGTPLETIEGGTSVNTALAIMARAGVRHLAVTSGEEIIGLLSVEDAIDPAWLEVAGWPAGRGRR
jgi:CBS domain-containing protein